MFWQTKPNRTRVLSVTEWTKDTTPVFLCLIESPAEVSSSDVLKSLFSRDFCHVCGAMLQFESQRVSHYEGKKHAQKVRLYLQTKREEERRTSELTFFQKDGSVDPDRFCQLCNMVFSAPVVAKSHYEGKVHAKNLKKLGMHPTVPAIPQTGDPAPQGSPLTPSSQEEGKKEAQEEEEERTSQEPPGPPVEGVDLNDPNKHCRLCVASFNNPQMARQHYTGRKHQRNHVRYRALQEMEELGRPGAHLDSRTFSCPVCNVTLNSVEMYQAHMQGNKHQQKELKVSDMIFKSQKKVYDCFQDELADYIQVQKARGLEPRTQRAAEPGEGGEEEKEEGNEGNKGKEGKEEHVGHREEEEAFSGVAGLAQCVAPSHFWHLPFPTPSTHPHFGPQTPEGPSWGRSFPPMALPFAAATVATGFGSRPRRGEAGSGGYSRERTRHRRSNRDRSTSSASSTTSSSSSSSSSSTGSDNHRRRERRRKRMRKERERRAKDEDSEEEEKRRGRRSRQQRRKSRRSGEEKQEEGRQAKRRRVVEVGEVVAERGEEEVQEKEQPPEDTKEKVKTEKGPVREGKAKHRKEKKRTKERTDKTDTRTEEERLWDESILGLV